MIRNFQLVARYIWACAEVLNAGGQLTISNFATSGDRLLCKTHFMEEFATSGGHYGGDDKFQKGSSSRSNSTASSVSTPKATNGLPNGEQDLKSSSSTTDASNIEQNDKTSGTPITPSAEAQTIDTTETRVTAEILHSKAAPVDKVPKRISVAERIKQDQGRMPRPYRNTMKLTRPYWY